MPRRCRVCGNTLPVTAFNVDRSRHDGHGYVCRACRRVSPTSVPNRIERAAARERGMAWCRGCATWCVALDVNKQGLCRPHQRESDRKRYACDSAHRQRRRSHASMRSRGIDAVPIEGVEALTELYEGRCAYCAGEAQTFDHVIPVSKGGKTEPFNMLPACKECNSSKRDRDLLEWIDATGRELHWLAVDQLSHFQVI